MAVAALCVTKALSTLMRFQQYAKTHRSIRVHTTVLIRFDCPSIFLMKCSKPIELNVSWTLCASYKHAFWCVFDRFQPSSLIRYVCIFVLIHSVVGASSMRVTAGYFTTYGSFVSKLVINRVLYYSYNHCCGLMNGAWLPCVDNAIFGCGDAIFGCFKKALQNVSSTSLNADSEFIWMEWFKQLENHKWLEEKFSQTPIIWIALQAVTTARSDNNNTWTFLTILPRLSYFLAFFSRT